MSSCSSSSWSSLSSLTRSLAATPLSNFSPSSMEDPSNPRTSLLPQSSSTPSPPTRRSSTAVLFSTLLITTCLALSAAFAFAFLFFSTSTSTVSSTQTKNTQLSKSLSRPLTKLPHPVVLLISCDGFRFGYQYKTNTPNIHRLIANGTEAQPGLIPVFPTLTFPNHYSIVTGLYPPYHGIINNNFIDPIDGSHFTMASHEPKWWLGEPLWETVVNQGLKAATYFWPGSEVKKGDWDCPPGYCQQYDESVPFDKRVDTVLSYFDLSGDEMPSFITLYFEDPDEEGHLVGPDGPEITTAVANMDRLVGRLIDGLEKRGIFEDVTMILVGDHGMVGTCDKKLLFLDDLSPWIEIPTSWVRYTTPVLSIAPTENISISDVVAKMNKGLSSGKVENGNYLKMYLKEDLPERLHYSDSYRIPPIIGLLDESYKIESKRTTQQECGGAHGYDNDFFSMRTIFVAHGPQFERGLKIPSFENVQIYNLVTSILNINGAPNNGSSSFADDVLLPRY